MGNTILLLNEYTAAWAFIVFNVNFFLIVNEFERIFEGNAPQNAFFFFRGHYLPPHRPIPHIHTKRPSPQEVIQRAESDELG